MKRIKQEFVFIQILFQIYRDWDELKQVIDVSILPEELGGSTSIPDIIKNFKETIVRVENELKVLPALIYDTPNETKNWDTQKSTENSDGLSGSFRKLEID